jgi:hypothetical protein
MTLLPVAEGRVDGVNSSGFVIGTSGPDYAGWIYRNGKVSPLTPFHGDATPPNAINTRGDVVGQATTGKNETSVIWPAAQPDAVRALRPAGVLVSTIADNGTIGGSFQNKPYVGDGNGHGQTLATGASHARGAVYQIRGHYAVGWGLSDTDVGLYPMVWNLATGIRTPYPKVGLFAIGDDGTVVGNDSLGSHANVQFGLIGRGGVLKLLPGNVAGDPPVSVSDVSADGTTVVGQRDIPNAAGLTSRIGLLWHC